MKIAAMIARYLLGLIFTVFGINGFVNFLPAPELSGVSAEFMGAMFGSGYIYVIKLLEVVGGVLLLAGRFVPLALTLLTPVVVNILLFHIFLDPAGMPIAIVVTVLNAILLYANRLAFVLVLKP